MAKFINKLHQGVVTVVLCAVCALTLSLSGAMLYDSFCGNSAMTSASLVHALVDRVAGEWHRWLLLYWSTILIVSTAFAISTAMLLWLELRDVAKRKPQLILSRGSFGEVAISLDQVGLLAQHEAEAIEGVREVSTITESSKAGLAVKQTIVVEANRQLTTLAEEIQQQVKQSLEYHLGFPVAYVQVALQRTSISKALL